MRTNRAQEIKSRISVPSLFEKDGHKLRKVSGHFMCICPFHKEKSGSCAVYEDHFYCFGCGKNGDCFGYIMQTRGVEFLGALAVLGGEHVEQYKPMVAPSTFRNPVELTFDFTPLIEGWMATSDDDMMMLFACQIGVKYEQLCALQCCWSPDHRAWAFPMKDQYERIIGIRLRYDDGRKIAVTGSKNALFIPIHKPQRRLFICEGPTDTAACLSLGFWTIGRPSCNAAVDMTLGFIARNQGIREVVIVADNDGPGIQGAKVLRDKLTVPSKQILLPSKDIRRFAQLGGGAQVIETMLANQMSVHPKQQIVNRS